MTGHGDTSLAFNPAKLSIRVFWNEGSSNFGMKGVQNVDGRDKPANAIIAREGCALE